MYESDYSVANQRYHQKNRGNSFALYVQPQMHSFQEIDQQIQHVSHSRLSYRSATAVSSKQINNLVLRKFLRIINDKLLKAYSSFFVNYRDSAFSIVSTGSFTKISQQNLLVRSPRKSSRLTFIADRGNTEQRAVRVTQRLARKSLRIPTINPKQQGSRKLCLTLIDLWQSKLKQYKVRFMNHLFWKIQRLKFSSEKIISFLQLVQNYKTKLKFASMGHIFDKANFRQQAFIKIGNGILKIQNLFRNIKRNNKQTFIQNMIMKMAAQRSRYSRLSIFAQKLNQTLFKKQKSDKIMFFNRLHFPVQRFKKLKHFLQNSLGIVNRKTRFIKKIAYENLTGYYKMLIYWQSYFMQRKNHFLLTCVKQRKQNILEKLKQNVIRSRKLQATENLNQFWMNKKLKIKQETMEALWNMPQKKKQIDPKSLQRLKQIIKKLRKSRMQVTFQNLIQRMLRLRRIQQGFIDLIKSNQRILRQKTKLYKQVALDKIRQEYIANKKKYYLKRLSQRLVNYRNSLYRKNLTIGMQYLFRYQPPLYGQNLKPFRFVKRIVKDQSSNQILVLQTQVQNTRAPQIAFRQNFKTSKHQKTHRAVQPIRPEKQVQVRIVKEIQQVPVQVIQPVQAPPPPKPIFIQHQIKQTNLCKICGQDHNVIMPQRSNFTQQTASYLTQRQAIHFKPTFTQVQRRDFSPMRSFRMIQRPIQQPPPLIYRQQYQLKRHQSHKLIHAPQQLVRISPVINHISNSSFSQNPGNIRHSQNIVRYELNPTFANISPYQSSLTDYRINNSIGHIRSSEHMLYDQTQEQKVVQSPARHSNISQFAKMGIRLDIKKSPQRSLQNRIRMSLRDSCQENPQASPIKIGVKPKLISQFNVNHSSINKLDI